MIFYDSHGTSRAHPVTLQLSSLFFVPAADSGIQY